MQVFTAHVEQSISVDPNDYYKKEQLENTKLLTVSSGKTDSIDFICEKVIYTFNNK